MKPEVLSQYQDKVLLIVNVASKCGFTNQYTALQALKEKFNNRDFEILAFPCNQFGSQEKGSNQEIQDFCSLNFGVTFPVHDKIEVNGNNEDPLYSYLKEQAPGFLGSKKIKWNFTKFLISKNGQKITRYAPQFKPEKLEVIIEKLLS